jgi:pimeloyl-ACP methyl ester carboxylesterase
MVVTTSPMSPAGTGRVGRTIVDTDGVPLSVLIAEPERTPPRAVVVALHGAGMNASYFHGGAHPDLSLATLAAGLGCTVLAFDRPGYGASATALPSGQRAAEQAGLIRTALRNLAATHPVGAGYLLLGHSFGGKVALSVAAAGSAGVLGVDVSGCGLEYDGPMDLTVDARTRRSARRNWGALRCYPPGTFRSSEAVVSAVPPREWADAVRWPQEFPSIAAQVRTPVRFTFAEHESWWRHDDEAIAALRARFTAAPRIVVDRQPDSGHNISLGWAARAYHLRALGFLEECLAAARCAVP